LFFWILLSKPWETSLLSSLAGVMVNLSLCCRIRGFCCHSVTFYVLSDLGELSRDVHKVYVSHAHDGSICVRVRFKIDVPDDSPQEDDSPRKNEDEGGLGTGEIIVIVIDVIGLIAIIVVGCWFVRRSKKRIGSDSLESLASRQGCMSFPRGI
jgi:hypothetical protein